MIFLVALFISFACPKETNQRKGQPRRCFSPLSENIENLCKVVPSASWLTANAVGAFEDFLIFSDSRQYWPAVWACQRSTSLEGCLDRLRNNSVFQEMLADIRRAGFSCRAAWVG